MVHKNIFQMVQQINQFLNNPNPEMLETFFQLEYGSLVKEKDQIIDYRNPSLTYQIVFHDQPKSVEILPSEEIENQFFKLFITTQYGGLWLYSYQVFDGVLRIDDMILADRATRKMGRMITRVFDSVSYPYIWKGNQQRNWPRVIYTNDLIPDLEFESNPQQNIFTWKYKGLVEKKIKGTSVWYQNHLLNVIHNPYLDQMNISNGLTRKKTME